MKELLPTRGERVNKKYISYCREDRAHGKVYKRKYLIVYIICFIDTRYLKAESCKLLWKRQHLFSDQNVPSNKQAILRGSQVWCPDHIWIPDLSTKPSPQLPAGNPTNKIDTSSSKDGFRGTQNSMVQTTLFAPARVACVFSKGLRCLNFTVVSPEKRTEANYFSPCKSFLKNKHQTPKNVLLPQDLTASFFQSSKAVAAIPKPQVLRFWFCFY